MSFIITSQPHAVLGQRVYTHDMHKGSSSCEWPAMLYTLDARPGVRAVILG